MAFTFDMEKDLRYQAGYEVGLKRGFEKETQKWKAKVIINLSKSDMNNEKIAEILEVSIEFVEAILKENK